MNNVETNLITAVFNIFAFAASNWRMGEFINCQHSQVTHQMVVVTKENNVHIDINDVETMLTSRCISVSMQLIFNDKFMSYVKSFAAYT